MKKQFIIKASDEAKQKINSASTHEYYETLEHPYEEEVLGCLTEIQVSLHNLIKNIDSLLDITGGGNSSDLESLVDVLMDIDEIYSDEEDPLNRLSKHLDVAVNDIENNLYKD